MGIRAPRVDNGRMFEETNIPARDEPGADGEKAAATARAAPAVRAQLLATEHWSLLALRSTTQAEVLTRISIFLTLTSAALVSLALAGQAMNFDDTFVLLAIIILVVVIIVGQLTQIRVLNVGFEDLSCVLAMNRLRAAYAELDPGIERYLMASRYDDRAGSQQSYYMLPRRTAGGHVAGSSMVLILVVNAALAGILVAALSASWGAQARFALTTGLMVGLFYIAAWMWVGGRRYFNVWRRYSPHFPSPEPGRAERRT